MIKKEVEEAKQYPMEKYIELCLDMEFSNDLFKQDIILGKLLAIDETLPDKYMKDSAQWFKNCRLRPNNVHWWSGKSGINPIPEDCEYRIYWIDAGWSLWKPCESKQTWGDKDIIEFEIRYIK